MEELCIPVVKLSPGLCRCCLSGGCYKDLTAEYPWMSETEVYADMLLECFDISLLQQPKGPDGANNLICEVCITRLRDATHFKKQVQLSERKFVNMMNMNRGKILNQVISNEMDPLIKHEAVKKEDPEDLHEAAREDLKLSGEDFGGLSSGDISRPSPTLGAGSIPKLSCITGLSSGDISRPSPTLGAGSIPCAFLCKKEKQDELVCSQCGQIKLKSHLLDHSDEKPFVCDVCSNVFTRKCDLTNHLRIHNRVKFPCSVCSKSFAKKSLLKIHSLIHSDERPFECNICGKRFLLILNLKLHKTHVHDGSKPFSCNICNKSFGYKTNLKNHMRIHSDDKPFACDICGQTFALKKILKCHLRVHSGVKSFSCNLCGRSFLKKAYLKSHFMSIHSDEKPFVCDICGKQFKQKSSLRLHMLVHTRIKRFKCNVCNKYFTQSCQLKCHIRMIHSVEKLVKFSCDVCGKKIARKNDFKKHLRIHSGVKPFACHVCSKAFTRASHVKRHLLTHSKITL